MDGEETVSYGLYICMVFGVLRYHVAFAECCSILGVMILYKIVVAVLLSSRRVFDNLNTPNRAIAHPINKIPAVVQRHFKLQTRHDDSQYCQADTPSNFLTKFDPLG